jgi:hypothetical protein
MTILRKPSAGIDHWAVQVSFALCVAGLAAWLIGDGSLHRLIERGQKSFARVN